MLRNLNDILRSDSGLDVTKLDLEREGAPTDKDLQIAASVVLLSIAHADNMVAPEEIESIIQSAQQQFGINRAAAIDLLTVSDLCKKAPSKIDEFVQVINDNLNTEEKVLLLSQAWKIICADGQVLPSETAFAARLRERLQLSMEQAIRARTLSEKGD